MKKYITLLIAFIVCTSLFSQESNKENAISLELSIRYEKTAFNNNYILYSLQDGTFPHISKKGNKFNIGAKASLRANQRNTLFIGLGLNGYQAKSQRENVFMSFLDLEFGHRFYIFKLSDYKFHFENSLNFGVNYSIKKYFLKGTFLDLRTGIHIEKYISKNLNMIFGVNYGIGLIDAAIGESFSLKSKAVGFKIGIMKQL